MGTELKQLEAGILALEALRGSLGDAVVDASVAGLRAKLAAATALQSEASQSLRQVSILFLDVVGSTLLAQQLDPESISAVMDDALSRGTVIVEAHRGKVLQYAGDNILAAFGAEANSEDDAERAVHCGLALLELGRELGTEVQAAYGHPGFNFRVGVHTGSALLGGGVDAEGTIRGIAVNIAARMEQTAPVGGFRISHDTHAQVRGLFEVEAQGPLLVKGVDAPVQSYLVLRAKPRKFRIAKRGIEGVATRMIGRDAELETLQAAYKRLLAERRLSVVTVVAEAGIGKSRLLYEFEAWADARSESYIIFRGRANPQTSSQPYGLLRDIMAWRFQISDDDSIEEARAKVESGVVHLFEHDDGSDLAEGRAHLLGHLIGIDWQDSRHVKGILGDPKLIRNRAFDTAAQIFRRISASDGSPVVLQLENLHWADDESLDFLNYLTEVDRDTPLLVLASTRPTLFERRTDWRGTESMRQRIDLEPLDKTGSRMLANELLKKLPEIPAALRELVTSSSEGNPFYMEELISMLIDQGAIQTGETWKVDAERLLVTQVPPTLTGVLQARLDQLPAPEKRALQQASVVGSVFWDQALLFVDAQAAEQLPSLVQRELTLPQADAALDGLREYAFRHQVLHQVTYDTVLKRARREGHAKVAQWLANLSAQHNLRAGDFLGVAAEHFEQAGDEPNAAEFHARAAEEAVRRFAHERVLVHVGRALALLGEAAPDKLLAQAELRWRLLVARVRVLDLQAQRDEQVADLDAMDQLADLLADDQRRADVAWRRSLRAMRMADWAEHERSARQSLACATRAGDDFLRLRALRVLAAARLDQGDIDACRALTLQALDHARSLKLRGVELRGLEAMLLDNLANVAAREGNWVATLDFIQQSLAISREYGDRVNEAIGLMTQGAAWMALGDLEQARRDLDAALHMLRANGHRDMEGAALGHLSTLALWQGDETRALGLARSSLEIAVAAKARESEVTAELRLGDAELSLGRLGDAMQAYARARSRALEINSHRQFDACAGLARVALAEGDASAALDAVQPVLEHVATGGKLEGLTNWPRRIEITCRQALACAGDPRATQWLSRAHTALMTEADAIGDVSLRKGYLQNIPDHREVVVAWAMRSTPPR